MQKKHLITMTAEGPRLHSQVDEYMDPIVSILNETPEEMNLIFENVDVSVANALRRILISEVPTMAIETVKMYLNTGIMQDEAFCHRLGLIPLQVDPDEYEFRRENEELKPENSVCFKLHVKGPPKGTRQEGVDQVVTKVTAKDLNLVRHNEGDPEPKENCRVVHDNLLLTKLATGQEIELLAYAEKGIGKGLCLFAWNLCSIINQLLIRVENHNLNILIISNLYK
eukprot:GHVP01033403.1.p1 GENE.GHVP01033403.1~~GHVP01033403.1.p1  ORF type:complete len:226 (+),score=39.85 GHVP01033403.1:272-949(+)